MPTTAVIMALAFSTCIITLLGGLLALSLRKLLSPILGFTAGAVIGLAFFDLIPEAMTLAANVALPALAIGFFAYMIFDNVIGSHHDPEHAIMRGVLGASSLSAHSFLDGFGIGVGFQAGQNIGIVVAAAVLAHDFADGLNTVNVVVKSGGTRRDGLKWLITDAVAPVIGATTSLFFEMPRNTIGLVLALLAGFFLYLGACDLIPASQHLSHRWPTWLATLAGAVYLFVVVHLAG